MFVSYFCIFFVLSFFPVSCWVFLPLSGVFHSQSSFPGSDPAHLHLFPVAIKPGVFNLHISLSPFSLPVFTLPAGWHSSATPPCLLVKIWAFAYGLAVVFVFIVSLSTFYYYVYFLCFVILVFVSVLCVFICLIVLCPVQFPLCRRLLLSQSEILHGHLAPPTHTYLLFH